MAQTAPLLQPSPVQLPLQPGKNTAPFDRPRTLNIPAGFAIHLLAREADARFLARAPNGDLLVSIPSTGTIALWRLSANGTATRMEFVSGLRNPHDLVFHTLDGVTWLYVAESHRIVRTRYKPDQTHANAIDVVVDGLPDASSSELRGNYGHQLKNIALNGNKLYVSIASTCNACAADATSDPIRSAIYEYDANGGQRRLYARGIRNAEGLAFRPGTNELWVVVNNRDNIAYPFHKDFNGDGSDDYGKVLPSYVDGHPPELLIKLRDGGNYGWPFCNANPDKGLDHMPYDRDVQHNANGDKLDCGALDPITKGMPAHSAPLGFSFLPAQSATAYLRNAMVVAQHGCWNCTALNGHKVVLYSLLANGQVGNEMDLVSGWITDPKKHGRWGRPVDAIPDGNGGLYISDDEAGAIYQLKPTATAR